jgi:hypothetical protein
MSTKYASQFLDELGVQHNHAAIHNRVHMADLRPFSTESEDQVVVGKKMIRVDGND